MAILTLTFRRRDFNNYKIIEFVVHISVWDTEINATLNDVISKEKQIIKQSKSSTASLLKENTELPIAQNFTKPSKSTELPNCRKHFEVRRCRVSVLNIEFQRNCWSSPLPRQISLKWPVFAVNCLIVFIEGEAGAAMCMSPTLA